MLRITLGVSLALHMAFGVWVKVRDLARDETKVVVDSWRGAGIEIAVGTESAAPLAAVAVPPAPDTAGASVDGVSAPPRSALRHANDDGRESRPVPPRAALRHDPPDVAEHAEHTAVRSTGAAAREGAKMKPDKPPAAAQAARAGTGTNAAANTANPATSGETPAASGENLAASGAFGAAGLPAGVRHLPKAFTRAVGLASRGDPRWLTLSPGTVGEARIRLSVDADGRLGELEYVAEDERARLAPVVAHLLENTRLLLLAGRFSLDPGRAEAGAQTLRVRVEITERKGEVDPDADPNGLHELEYTAPSGGKPGRGSFRLNSGRRVIGWVYVE